MRLARTVRTAALLMTAPAAAVAASVVPAEAPSQPRPGVAAPAAPADAGPDGVDVIAHRGSSGVAPENSAAAVTAAVRQRADFVEIDVQRTRDGRLVNFHDCTMERTTDVEERFPGRSSYRISEFTLAELRTLDSGSWFDERFAGEPIITVREVIRRLGRHTGLLAEISPCGHYQNTGLPTQLATELRSIPDYVDGALEREQLAVQSFAPGDAREFHDALPDVPVGVLDAERPTEAELTELSTWADQVNPQWTVTDTDLVERVHELGMEINVWTVDEPGRLRTVRDLGVDGIITDYPQSLTLR
ncbi:glycerophosphoryl diester phosphodiesterase [Haloactinopolyspora alba]|uniref:Glycerophosphoryl diester phosphodiesterase n=1 Tax=Haloactinopolyspora alba TaxID=648780 RepID=A0A2P8E8S5_9ACTN|nr:glycerophosphodiester phosphodiesterase [Haloactinopolyspora alba]PSL05863.1 glycerophosphoryl diester phosphodiesterase [Haloactinopolyspora alba]